MCGTGDDLQEAKNSPNQLGCLIWESHRIKVCASVELVPKRKEFPGLPVLPGFPSHLITQLPGCPGAHCASQPSEPLYYPS